MTSLGSSNEFAASAADELLDSTGDGSITPDPFLAKVARVPSRADAFATTARTGDKFGRFEVRGELGRGGMGIVYVAIDTTLGREVALKVLPASGDVERRRRFLREARSAAAVTHPGIATVYEVGEQDGAVFIAMERVRGKTLRVWLDENRDIPIVEAQRIGRAIARTLAKAHELGVVHRDLKPENAMLTDEDDVKLLDFGLAKLVGPSLSETGSTTDTQEGRILGTPCYMSPEQARGLAVDARSDVFSFGVMLYELLTGQRPFSGSTSVDLMASITRDEPRPVHDVVAGVSAEVSQVVSRCLRKDPGDRYADGRALLKDLERACQAEPSAEKPSPPSVSKEEAPPKRDPGLSRRIIGTALGLSLVAIASAAWWQSSSKAAPGVTTLLAPSVASSAAVSALEVPALQSRNAEALEAYRQGLASFHKGEPWVPSFMRAVELDPTFVEAHVYIATGRLSHFSPERSREHYRKAMELSGKLPQRERILLDAIEPLILRQPSDWSESMKRFAKAVEKFPNDAAFWLCLALATANFEDFGKANEYLAQAIRIDPAFGHARSALALNTAYMGQFEAAEAAAEECLKVAPDSVSCMELIARLRLREGHCEAMANVARRMIAAGASRVIGELRLAQSLAAQGQPIAMVEQALAQAEASRLEMGGSSPSFVNKQFTAYRARARMLAGDFENAETRVRELETFSQTSRMQDDRGAVAKMLVQVMLETGRKQEAGDVLMNFLDRRDAWEPNPSAEDAAMAADATPFLLLAAGEAERLSSDERMSRRDLWLRDWKFRATPVARNYLWLHAYASTSNTPEESKQALDVLEKQGQLPPYRPETMVDAYVGRTYLLAGRTDDAITWLGHATQSCASLQFPFEQTRAFLWLGQAKETKGDTKGACGAYRVVLDRWGHAKPKSVSAEQARARVSALGCQAT